MESRTIHQRSASQMSDLAMLGERNGISITAIPEKEVDQMRAKISELKNDLEVAKDKLRQDSEETIVLRMNCEQMAKDLDLEREESLRAKHNFELEVQQIDQKQGEKLQQQKTKYVKKMEKLSQHFSGIFESKIEEIQIEAETKLNSARMSEAETHQTLEQKQKQLEKEYIRVQDHETIINERERRLQKQHEVEILELGKKFEQEISGVKRSLENEIQKTHMTKATEI